MPLHGEPGRERLDHVEHLVDLALVARERDRLGERVGDHQKALRRQVLDLDRAAGRLLLVALGRDFQDGVLVVAARPLAADPGLQLGERVLLLERGQADHHRDAETEEGHHPLVADAKSERRQRNHVRPLEPDRVDALADDQCPRGEARRGGELLDGSLSHAGKIRGAGR